MIKSLNDVQDQEVSNLKHFNLPNKPSKRFIGISRNPFLPNFLGNNQFRQASARYIPVHHLVGAKRFSSGDKIRQPMMCYHISSEFLVFGGKICEDMKRRKLAMNPRISQDYTSNPQNEITIAKKHLINDFSGETAGINNQMLLFAF